MANAYSSDTRGQVQAAGPAVDPGALTVAAIVVAGLYLGQEVLVPLVVAVLLSFVLALPVRFLQGIGLGRRLPVAVVVVLAFAFILTIAGLLTSQLAQLAGDLPRYQTTIREKVSTFRKTASGSGPMERLADMLQGLSEEVNGKEGAPAGAPTLPARGDPVEKPVPVEITNTRTSPLATISGYVAPILHPLTTTALIAVFTVFMLLQRGDLRNRAIRLAGSQDLQRTTAAMNDAASRLSRFFLAQVLLNGGFGLAAGIGLWALGVPSPVLWGILAAISRFVPYVGVVLAAGGPLLLAAAVDPGWTMLVWTAAFFACSEFLLGQVVEPLVYGRSTGLSPVAVIVSVTFWTWLWGPVGLILATPLTVCLVVLGRHVERLEFLDVMLGDRPALTVAESFYQRVLAGDAGEAIESAEAFVKDHPLPTFYDEVAVPGLALAQVDLSRGALDEGRLARISDAMGQLVEELADHLDDEQDPDAKRAEPKRAAGDADLDRSLDEADAKSRDLPVLSADDLPDAWRGDAPVLCVAGRNELDRMSAAMLAQILARHGLPARVEPAEILTIAGSGRLSDSATRVVCLSYLDTSAPVHVRYAVRRIRRRLPDATIVVGSWGLDPGKAQDLCRVARSDVCASRLTEAARICLDAAAPSRAAAPSAANQTCAIPARATAA